MCGIEWKSQFEGKGVNDCYKLFKVMYESLCESHIPKKSSRVLKRRAPWMNEEILAMSRRKKELWILNRNLKWKICSLVREYREIRKEIKKITRRSVRAFEESIASD